MLLLIAYWAGVLPPVARKGLRVFLEVILHIGAHRTGTTSLQRALQQNRHNLKKNGVVVWGPRETRDGLFSGLLGGAGQDDAAMQRLIDRNRGAIRMEMQRLKGQGMTTLLVSEENILGSMRTNLRSRFLYPGLQERLGRFSAVFGASLKRVGMAIRPYQDYWASALSYAIRAGHAPLCEDDLDRLVTQPRNWQRVIGEVAAACPQAKIAVWEFGHLIGRPQAQFRLLMGGQGWIKPMAERHNASPGREVLRALLIERGDPAAAAVIAPGDGAYRPFGDHHNAAFLAQYQTDLAWLRGRSTGEISFRDGVETVLPPPLNLAKRGFG